MKTRIIILVSTVLTSLSVCGQDWIGNHFTLDTIVEFQGTHMPVNPNQLQCRMFDGTFYFVEQQGFQYKENGHQAVIHTLSTENYEQTEIVLPLPECDRNKERYARNLWIYDFSLDGDHILLTTQDELILYKQIHNQIYRVESTFRHPNLFMGYLHQNKVYFFEENHDEGFKWFQQDLEGDSAVLVGELRYEAPHTVQIQPNRYLFHTQQSVLFLSTRHPRVEVYDLDGTFRDSIRFDLPLWKAFEDEYIRKTLSVPYGIERIYAVKDELYDYSYPKVVMPLRGDLLLLYMQIDSTTGKSALQYAIRRAGGLTTRHPRTNHEDSIYTARRFPFTLFQGNLDKGHADGSGKIIQLTYKTDVSWLGKSNSAYLAEVDRYFTENTPVLAYKVMSYSPPWEEEFIRLFLPGGRSITLDSLPAEKSVLFLHQGLECSGCVKAVYGLLSQSPLDGVHIGQVYPKPISGLSVHELNNQIRLHLDKPFSIYYDTTTRYRHFSPSPPLQDSDFPCLILYRKGERPVLYRSSDLFTPNHSITEFNDTFLDAWHSFLTVDR